MTPDIPFEVDFPIVVPQKLRNLLNKNLRSTNRITVQRNEGEGRTPKVNGIKLTTAHGAFPKETLEEICEAVTAIMHIAWTEQETEDPDIGLPPMDFVVVCEQLAPRPGGGKPKRVRLSFGFVYKGDAVSDDEMEEDITIEERAVQRAMETLERQNQTLIGHVDQLHTMVLHFFKQQSDASTAQGAASAETMKQALPLFFGGVQQMLNAKFMEYSIGKAEAEAKAASDRFVNSVKALAPYLGMAVQQFVGHKLAKMGVNMGDIGAAFGGGAPGSSETASGPDDATAEVPTELVAEFATQLGHSLTNQQRREIGRRFTVKQVHAIDDLFCVQTDAEAFSAYEKVVELAGEKLVELQQLLSQEQMQILMGFMQALQQYAERNANEQPS